MEMDEESLPMFILRLGENGTKKPRLAQKWKPLKAVNLFLDQPVPSSQLNGFLIFDTLSAACRPVVRNLPDLLKEGRVRTHLLNVPM